MKDSITAVIIGLNENKNLRNAIRSVQKCGISEVVYVDSGSTDDSVAVAERNGAMKLVIKNSFRSPGFARNVGVDHVDTPFVLLMDGDMKLDSRFVDKALPMFQNQSVACVTGPIKEKYPRKNIYHRAISVHWLFAQKGKNVTPAGGGLFRTEYFKQVQGYNPEIPAGEEIELRNKLVERGYVIKSSDTYFADHDLGIEGLGDFVRRAIREGRLQGYALMHSDNKAISTYRRLAIKNCVLMLAFFVLCLLAGIMQNIFLVVIPAFVLFLLVFVKNYSTITKHQDPVAMGMNILFSYLKIPMQVYALFIYIYCE